MRTTVDGSFSFDSEFQRKLIKLALVDDGFCTIALKHLRAEMFESDALRWCWTTIVRERNEKRTPTMLVLRDFLHSVSEVLQYRYRAMLDAIDQDVLREDDYIRHALGEFIRRNMFVSAYNVSQKIYNMGKADDAIEHMRQASEQIHQIHFRAPARHMFFDDIEERNRRRSKRSESEWDHTFPTGIVGVDDVLDGGLSVGELGVWMADSKGGKSLFLIHLAGYTCRVLQRKVLLVLLEGDYLQTASRLDSWFSGVAYREAKRGQFEHDVYRRLQDEYRRLKGLLVIREFTDASYNVMDIRAEIDELKAQSGWVPAQLVVDYGDLLRSSTKAASEEEHQRNAFSELKALCHQDQGYAMWSASQARRPGNMLRHKKEKGEDEGSTFKFGKPVLGPKDIADSYNKVRRVDFLGSINQDAEDKANSIARLYCAVYRDNAADRLVKVRQNLDKMLFADVMDPLNRPDRPEAIAEELARKRRPSRPNNEPPQQKIRGKEWN